MIIAIRAQYPIINYINVLVSFVYRILQHSPCSLMAATQHLIYSHNEDAKYEWGFTQ